VYRASLASFRSTFRNGRRVLCVLVLFGRDDRFGSSCGLQLQVIVPVVLPFYLTVRESILGPLEPMAVSRILLAPACKEAATVTLLQVTQPPVDGKETFA